MVSTVSQNFYSPVYLRFVRKLSARILRMSIVDATTREYQPPEYSYIRRKLRITRLRLSDGKLHSSGWYVRV